MANKHHHRGTHQRHSAMVRRAATANKASICWACGLTLNQHTPHANGKPPTWQAGHTIDGTRNPPPWLNTTTTPPPGPWLAPEASTCNTSRGAVTGNRRRSTGYDWP
jgi:hypothetical protein